MEQRRASHLPVTGDSEGGQEGPRSKGEPGKAGGLVSLSSPFTFIENHSSFSSGDCVQGKWGQDRDCFDLLIFIYSLYS